LSDKQDSDHNEAYDGKQTVVDDPQGLAPVAAKPKVDPEVDPEEKPTELWAPVAKTLFQDEASHPEDKLPDRGLVPRSGEIEDGSDLDPEEAGTELMGEPPPGMAIADTVKMTSEEAAAAIAEAEQEAARLLSDTVEVSGEEGEAARRIALEQRRLGVDATQVLDKPLLPQLNRECRMCGKKVESPRPIRFRGPAISDRGFRCEKCNNVFCAAHVVRVSGLIESFFSTGRFRCQLCVPKKGK
jgi:hypothetical protein